MRFKLTPLNIVAAMGLLAALLLLLNQFQIIAFQVSGMKALFVILFFMISLVAFVSDLIFRKIITSLKRLWIIELTLITLTVVIIIVLKNITG